MFSPIWGKGNGRGISGFAVNRGAVNRGFTELIDVGYLNISSAELPYEGSRFK